MMEIEYSNPVALTAGAWQVGLAEEAVAGASAESALSAITDIEREVRGGTLVVRLPDGESDATVQAVRTAIESRLPTATHVETRTGVE